MHLKYLKRESEFRFDLGDHFHSIWIIFQVFLIPPYNILDRNHHSVCSTRYFSIESYWEGHSYLLLKRWILAPLLEYLLGRASLYLCLVSLSKKRIRLQMILESTSDVDPPSKNKPNPLQVDPHYNRYWDYWSHFRFMRGNSFLL